MTTEQDHVRFADDLPLLVGGGLAADRTTELRDHIATCPDCAQAYWELVDARDALVHAAPADPAPPDASAMLLRRLERESPAASRLPGRWRMVAAAAAVLLAFGAGWILGPRSGPGPEGDGTDETSVAMTPVEAEDIPATAVEEAYRRSLEGEDQFSRAMAYLSTLERESAPGESDR